MDSHLTSLGFGRSTSEPTLYVKKDEKETLLIVSLYVNDLGEMAYFLGMEAFALKILSRYCMESFKPMSTLIPQGEKLTNKGDLERLNETSYKSLV
ncbi:pleiotropic drug resistance protein 3-like [Gossypium australe]|uniref:Pleiotropic drug resistance protein 3-like n=1 Tax=Gossypium australe TaxID=47621 RepID=A0A5B6X1Z4_9ROSI|nr:pleiotropic drug resistance protein 3-like [Gossypium australe]